MLPHVITLYTRLTDPVTFEDVSYITILRGVLLDAAKAHNERPSGNTGADAVNLYIPADAQGVDGITGATKSYAPPKIFLAAKNKEALWTLDDNSTPEGVTFVVKGEIVEPDLDFQALNQRYDDVYRLTKVDEKDFGTIPHWEVGAK